MLISGEATSLDSHQHSGSISSPDFTPFKMIHDTGIIIIVNHHWSLLVDILNAHVVLTTDPVRSPSRLRIRLLYPDARPVRSSKDNTEIPGTFLLTMTFTQ
jgi:hypothetical protein